MQDHSGWEKPCQALKTLGLAGITAAILEHGGPFNLFLAQMLYFSKPFASLVIPEKDINRLARILENDEASLSFARHLRQEQ